MPAVGKVSISDAIPLASVRGKPPIRSTPEVRLLRSMLKPDRPADVFLSRMVAVNVTLPPAAIVLEPGERLYVVGTFVEAWAHVNIAGEQKSPKLTIVVHVSALNCMTHSELNAAHQRY